MRTQVHKTIEISYIVGPVTIVLVKYIIIIIMELKVPVSRQLGGTYLTMASRLWRRENLLPAVEK